MSLLNLLHTWAVLWFHVLFYLQMLHIILIYIIHCPLASLYFHALLHLLHLPSSRSSPDYSSWHSYEVDNLNTPRKRVRDRLHLQLRPERLQIVATRKDKEDKSTLTILILFLCAARTVLDLAEERGLGSSMIHRIHLSMTRTLLSTSDGRQNSTSLLL